MWLIYAYYFSWVGIGGRIMGAAYALAHKEVTESLFKCRTTEAKFYQQAQPS